MGASTAANPPGFEGIITERYTLQIWESIFQIVEAKARNNPMLSPEVINKANGESLKPPYNTVNMAEHIPEDFIAKGGQVMDIWIKAWYHRYKEEKKMLRGNQETSFNYIMDIRASIERDLKEGKIEYYVVNIWESVCIAKNRAKKGVTFALKAKEYLEQLKARENTETSNIKAELQAAREETERGERGIYIMENLQR